MSDHIQQIDFNHINELPDIDYTDGDIAFHRDICDLPVDYGTIRTDIYIIVACLHGRLQAEINTRPYSIGQNDILVCLPNVLIDNYMISPDFDGAILCLSSRVVMESLSESELWNRAFRVAANPVISISERSLRLFSLYGEILREKIQAEPHPFKKEVILALTRAALYELLSSVGTAPSPIGYNLAKQKDVLFRRFLQLLAGSPVKQRQVTWYARQLCITPKHLSTVCRQVSGRTAYDWINEYVMVDIRHALKNSSKSIKEVAYALNFPNLSFFGKYCRTRFGVSPTQLRERLRSEND